jgi:hypothetical protein
MAKSKIEKRQLHKKQRNPNKQLNNIIKGGSIEDIIDFEDGINIYNESSNNYTTMRSNEQKFREYEDS